jgi:hypothetical protein
MRGIDPDAFWRQDKRENNNYYDHRFSHGFKVNVKTDFSIDPLALAKPLIFMPLMGSYVHFHG